jgi:hypothetical protein
MAPAAPVALAPPSVHVQSLTLQGGATLPGSEVEAAAPVTRPPVPPPPPPPPTARGRAAVRKALWLPPPDPELPRAVIDVGRPEASNRFSAGELLARSEFAFSCINVGATNARQLEGGGPGGMMRDRATLRAHGIDIFKATLEFRDLKSSTWANYTGPWIEDYFIHTFVRPVVRYWTRGAGGDLVPHTRLKPFYVNAVGGPAAVQAEIAATHDAALAAASAAGESTADLVVTVDPYDVDLFMPYVPLFISWTSLPVLNGFSPEVSRQLALKIRGLLRQDVQYVTLIQHAEGLYLANVPVMAKLLKNVLVLSSGGKGHVPLPLLAKPLPPVPPREFADHKYVTSFIGTAERGAVRTVMLSALNAYQPLLAADGVTWLSKSFPTGSAWKDAMADSLFQLAPRGTGRTSFRMYEALQMGLIPVYIWDDLEWLPYRPPAFPAPRPPSVWDDIAFSMHVSHFPAFVRDTLPLLAADPALHARMTAAIAAAVPRYFTYEAVIRHVLAFLRDPRSSELHCAARARA